jgi:regulatory protein
VKNKNIDALKPAKNYAFLLLKFRPRSEKELYQRLEKKKFDEKIIKETLEFLKDKNFIDDSNFAKTWIESRLKKPLGVHRIRQELNLKGIDRQIIDTQLEEALKGYCEEEIVRQIAKNKFRKLKTIEPLKAKRRIYAYLLRRGFSMQAVADAINSLIK